MSTVLRPPSGPHPGVDHPSLVPALLLADSLSADGDGRQPVRRSVRDWVVDVSLFFAAVGLGLLLLIESTNRVDPPSDGTVFADLVVGLVSCLFLWGRRRWPVGVAVVLALVSAFSATAGAACLFALFTVAVHRAWRTVLLVAAVNFASFVVYDHFRPDPELPGRSAWRSERH